MFSSCLLSQAVLSVPHPAVFEMHIMICCLGKSLHLVEHTAAQNCSAQQRGSGSSLRSFFILNKPFRLDHASQARNRALVRSVKRFGDRSAASKNRAGSLARSSQNAAFGLFSNLCQNVIQVYHWIRQLAKEKTGGALNDDLKRAFQAYPDDINQLEAKLNEEKAMV